MNPNEQAIATVLKSYGEALNQSDTAAVMNPYAQDGVFMPQHFPSSVGEMAVHDAYNGVFNAITLNVKFEIAEIQQLAADWAIARTNSAGTVTVKASGSSGPEANQELFVFKKLRVPGKSRVTVYVPPCR